MTTPGEDNVLINFPKPVAELHLRHRTSWRNQSLLDSDIPGINEVKELLEEDDICCLAEEEDGVGCPLPSTPEDELLLDSEVSFC